MGGDITKFLKSPFLQNKFVLYGSLLVLLLAIIRFLANHNFNAIVLMALIGLLTSFFSKNMIIVLLTPLFAVVVLELIRGDMMIEGLENKDNDKDAAATSTATTADAAADNDATTTTGDNKENENNDGETVTEGETVQTTANDKPTEEKEHKPATKKQGMAQLTPANYDGKSEKSEKSGKSGSGNRIDYAATLEQAYDNIENIIGEDGVRGLTDQTKSLMNQQKELMNNMKDIEPLLKSAQGFMSQMTGKEGITGISKMLQGFAGAAKKPAENAKA